MDHRRTPATHALRLAASLQPLPSSLTAKPGLGTLSPSTRDVAKQRPESDATAGLDSPITGTLASALATRSLAFDTARRVLASGFGTAVTPEVIARASENVRHPAGDWAEPVAVHVPTTPTLPPHVGLLVTGALEGVVLTAVCHCGAREEVLIISPFTFPVVPLDPGVAGSHAKSLTRSAASQPGGRGPTWAARRTVIGWWVTREM
jgi:hypothetical protein